MRAIKPPRKVICWLLPLVFGFLAGCQTLPAQEYESFEPLSIEKRIMNEVGIRWEVREDVAEVCAQASHMGKEQAYFTPPVACAVWDVRKQKCTVITGAKTTHLALGHEVRHCFEGRFHG